MFDPIVYMKALHGKMKATKTKYRFETVSGVNALEGILEHSRRDKYFFAVDDSQDGVTVRGAGGTYFERRPYTVFIIGQVAYGDMGKRSEVLTEAKAIFRTILSKLILDKRTIPVLDIERIQFYEVPPAFATGCSGLYFIFNIDNPVNLVYNATDWDV